MTHRPPLDTPTQRKSPRLANYDYAAAGIYFITVCTGGRRLLLGEVVDGEIRLSTAGIAVTRCWDELPLHFTGVRLDVYVVMPNHIHGLIDLTATHREFPSRTSSPTLHTIVNSFKSAATRQVNSELNTQGTSLWQRSFYDHVVRTEEGLARIREYIANNPRQWELDEYNETAGLRGKPEQGSRGGDTG